MNEQRLKAFFLSQLPAQEKIWETLNEVEKAAVRNYYFSKRG
jgi:hypothetical protein